MTSDDLDIDLTEKWTEYLPYDFRRAFERNFGFSLRRLAAGLQGGFSTLPPSGGGKSRGPSGRGLSTGEMNSVS